MTSRSSRPSSFPSRYCRGRIVSFPRDRNSHRRKEDERERERERERESERARKGEGPAVKFQPNAVARGRLGCKKGNPRASSARFRSQRRIKTARPIVPHSPYLPSRSIPSLFSSSFFFFRFVFVSFDPASFSSLARGEGEEKEERHDGTRKRNDRIERRGRRKKGDETGGKMGPT